MAFPARDRQIDSRPCPVCRSTEPSPFLRKQALVVVRCSRCHMVYADPLPPESEASHYDQLGRPFYLSPEKLEGDYAEVRFRRELRIFRCFCAAGDVLDFGCSTGAFLFQLARNFPEQYRGTGIDVSRAALDYAASRGVDVIPHSFLDHDFGARRFHAITFWAVLEHLPEPATFLRRAASLLHPGGVLIALVPNLRSLACRVLGARYRYILPQHVNYFTAGTLARLLESEGDLAVVQTGTSHFNPLVLWQDWRRGTDAEVPDAERASLLRRTTRLKQSPWLLPAHWGMSLIEGALSRAGLADNLWIVARRR